MYRRFNLIGFLMLLTMSFLGIFVSAVCFGDEAETVEDAFKNGTIKGAIGSYFEFTDAAAVNSDFGWSTGYLTLKYETRKWNGLELGARFFAHGQLYSDHDNGVTDPFAIDIESPYTLPELYLNCSYTENSSLTVGRWAHGKVSHIDDGQTEGAYVDVKEIPDLELIAGVMTRFAEIDYDDGEDFGRTNKAQDLSSEGTYGFNSKPYLLFVESKYKSSEMLTFKPYIMYQDGYAGVYGLDAAIESKLEDLEVTYGGEIYYYHIAADISGSSDSNCFAIFPYVKRDPVEITLGYAKFDDGDSLNKPAWLRDYLTLVDQEIGYGNAGSGEYFIKVKLTIEKFWTHFVYADNKYDFTTSDGDRSQEYELQFGYKLTKSLDVNLRLFDVQYHNVDNKDYRKVESLIQFKF